MKHQPSIYDNIKEPKLSDADHPIRTAAIRIIENIIEPLLKRGLNGKKYYETEDAIVNEIAGTIAHPSVPLKLHKHTITVEILGGCLVNVHGLPKGWNYKLSDLDL